MNLIAAFLDSASRRQEQAAIIDANGRSVTFARLVEASASLAAAYRQEGLQPGDRVLLAMPIGIDLYVALAALWRIGAVVVFPEPALGLRGLKHAVRITRPRAFLASGWYRLLRFIVPEFRSGTLALTPFLRRQPDDAIAELDGDHPALVSFTSGSTGMPKTIVRSHAFLAAQNDCVASLLRPVSRTEIDLVAFPVFVIANLGMGVTSVLPDWNVKDPGRADPDRIARHLRRHGVTRALIPPAICERLLLARDLPPLSAVFTGGGPVFPDVIEALAGRFPAAEIVAVYGSTEAEPIAHLHHRDVQAEDWRAMRDGKGLLAGRPIPEIELKIIDDEIVVTGDHVNKGYLDPSHDIANKVMIDGRIWHRTGDAGRLDEAGRLWLLGRHEARVGTLYPFALEVAARGWPGVRRAALLAIEGKAVLAVEGDGREIERWRERAAAFDVDTVRWVGRLPLDRRHGSKIDYTVLRDMVAAER